MANIKRKYSENIDGKFFVDLNCIACDNCTKIAPDFFKFSSNFNYAFVYNQPQNKHDETKCINALKSCPVLAIGCQK